MNDILKRLLSVGYFVLNETQDILVLMPMPKHGSIRRMVILPSQKRERIKKKHNNI